MKSGSLNLLEPSGTVKACNGIALPLYSLFIRVYVRKNISSNLTVNGGKVEEKLCSWCSFSKLKTIWLKTLTDNWF
jgi:hypothetical protein